MIISTRQHSSSANKILSKSNQNDATIALIWNPSKDTMILSFKKLLPFNISFPLWIRPEIFIPAVTIEKNEKNDRVFFFHCKVAANKNHMFSYFFPWWTFRIKTRKNMEVSQDNHQIIKKTEIMDQQTVQGFSPICRIVFAEFDSPEVIATPWVRQQDIGSIWNPVFKEVVVEPFRIQGCVTSFRTC